MVETPPLQGINDYNQWFKHVQTNGSPPKVQLPFGSRAIWLSPIAGQGLAEAQRARRMGNTERAKGWRDVGSPGRGGGGLRKRIRVGMLFCFRCPRIHIIWISEGVPGKSHSCPDG